MGPWLKTYVHLFRVLELQASGCRRRCSSDPLPVPARVALYHQTDRGLGLPWCSLQHEALYIDARECKGWPVLFNLKTLSRVRLGDILEARETERELRRI